MTRWVPAAYSYLFFFSFLSLLGSFISIFFISLFYLFRRFRRWRRCGAARRGAVWFFLVAGVFYERAGTITSGMGTYDDYF